MKRYCYIPTGNEVWFQVAVDLYNAGVAEPVLWTGDDRHFKPAKEIFGDAVVSKLEIAFYAEQITGIDYSGEYADFFLSDNYKRAKDRCLKMMDRLDLYGTFNRLDRDVIFNKLTMWILKRVAQCKPEALVVSENPHTHTHYLIYEICLFLDLEIVKFNNTLPLPLLYLQNARTEQKFERQINLDAVSDALLNSQFSEFVENIAMLSSSGSHVLPAIRAQQSEIRFINKIKYFFSAGFVATAKETWFQMRMYFSPHYYPINPYKLGVLGRERINFFRKRNLKVAFAKERQPANFNNPFIYYALSFEPERTTNPDGGEFHDQAIALAKLRELVPQDVQIIVKEHPTQFYRIERGTRGRSPVFYNLLNNIEGITLVGDDTDSLELIRKSVFVSSISGTVGFEAAIMGKPSLIFGDAWYAGCPNILKWDHTISYNAIADYVCQPPEAITEFLIEEKDRYMVPGCINISSQKKFAHHLDDKFRRDENAGVYHLLKRFFSSF